MMHPLMVANDTGTNRLSMADETEVGAVRQDAAVVVATINIL